MRFRMALASLMLLGVVSPVIAQTGGADSTSTPRAKSEKAPRTAWMFGFGAGYGMGGPSTDAGSPDQESGGTGSFRIGSGVSPNAMVGLEYLSWSASPTDSTSWEISIAGPSLTWFHSSNAYVRGMVGWGSMKTDFTVPPSVAVTRIHDDGFALLAAAGWEWRYRRRLAIAPEVTYAQIAAGGRAYTRLAAGSLQFNWYF